MKNNYQAHKTEKKVNALISLLVALGIGTSGVITFLTKLVKNDVKKEEITTSDNVEDNDSILYLSTDFDINNKDEVEKRAKDIYNISDKKISIDEIINILYAFNDKYDLIKFNSNDSQAKYEQIQNILLEIYHLLSINISDDTDNMIAIKENGELNIIEDKEIFSYMFMSRTSESKNLSIEFAKYVNDILDAINNGELITRSSQIYNLYQHVINSKDVVPTHKLLIIDDVKAKFPLYEALTKEQKEAIIKSYSSISNIVGSTIAVKTGAEYDANKGCTATTTPITEIRKSENPVIVEQKAGKTVTFDKPIKVEQGGKKVSQKSEETSKKIVEGTTRIEIETFKADVKEGTSIKKETGGKVIKEEYVSNDAQKALEILTESTTEKPIKYTDSDAFLIEEGGKSLN